MSELGPRPPTPEEAARNRRIIRAVAVLFVAVSLFVFAWGYVVTAGTRERAQATDVALRSVGWAILGYAAQHEGRFPSKAAEFEAAAKGGQPASVPAGEGWPSTQAAALEGSPAMDVAAAMGSVAVTWDPNGQLPPVLSVTSGVSGLGTVEMVNGWLTQFSQARSRQGGAPQGDAARAVAPPPAGKDTP